MKKLFEAWFNTSLQGVAFVEPVHNNQGDVNGFRYRLVNAAFAHILRQPKEELIGQEVKTAFTKDQENELFCLMVTVLKSGDEHKVLKHYHLSEEDIWHDITVTPMDDQLLVNIQDVSEQVKSEHELQQRLVMESIISSISSRLITLDATEVETYIEDALAQITTHINAERGSIFLYSDSFQRASCIHEWSAPGILPLKDKVQNALIDSFKWAHHQLAEGQVVRLEADNLPSLAIQEKAIFEAMSIYSVINLPLIQDNKTYGFIAFYTIGHPQKWDQNNILLLETFTTLVSSILHRRKQELAIQRVNQRLEGLRAIDQALLSYRLTEQSPLLIAMQYTHFMVPCDRIIVFQIDETTGMAVAKGRVIDGELTMNPDFSVPAHYIYKPYNPEKEINYFPDLQPDTVGGTTELRLYEQGVRSLIIFHLYHRANCIGAFALASGRPFFFTEEHLQIARELASPLAIILLLLKQDEQLKNYTEKLEQRVEERTQEIRKLSTLHQTILENAGQTILSTDIGGVIQTANQACESLLGYRPTELVGQIIRLELGSAEGSARFVFYEDNGQIEPSTTFLDLLTAHQGYLNFECVAIHKNGQPVPILLAASTLHDPNGNSVGYVGIATNISALKYAEARLKLKNQELNTIFREAIDLHCIADFEGNFLNVNQAWEQTLGYSIAELATLTFWHLIQPDEHEAVRQQFRGVVHNQPLHNQINHFRKKDGTYCVLEWNAIKIDQLIYASARDITERQQAENQLRNLNQRLQLATKAAGQGIWEIDIENDRLIWDDRVWEIYGVSPRDDFRFPDLLKIIHPDDLAPFLERYELDAARDTISNVTRIIRPDGATRYIEASGKIIRDQQGKAIRHIGVIWDVTEQKQAEKALRDSEQRFREIAENVDEVFWIHSAEPFRLLYLNTAFERVWGIRFQQLHQTPFAFMDKIQEEDQPAVWQLIDQYKRGQEGQLYFRMQGDDETLHWLFVRTFIIRDERDKVIRHIGIVSDVTSQKEKEIVLQQALLREQELNQLKSQFVSTASHEFRTPLATMQSSVDLIKLYLDLPTVNPRESIEKHLGVIEKEIDQFGGLLTDILTIGTIESGKISFNPRWVDIVAVCEEIIATHFSQQGDSRRVRLLLEGSPRPVFLDDKLMSHVIVNLLSNAFKFSTTDPCLRIVFEDIRFIIQIIDEGIGIPARELSTLFQAFFRASNTSAIPGTGLGLVIARQFVILHGGNLSLQSEEKKGTTCTITMPIECIKELD